MAFLEFRSPMAYRRPGARRRPFFNRLRMRVGGDLREIEIGLGGFQIGLRLLQLMIGFGRFDFGEELAGLHVRADVDIPFLQIAGGARVDGRIGERLRVAGQDDFLVWRRRPWDE